MRQGQGEWSAPLSEGPGEAGATGRRQRDPPDGLSLNATPRREGSAEGYLAKLEAVWALLDAGDVVLTVMAL
jgi:hypothetical protein